MTYASIITPVADAPDVEGHLAAAVMLARAYGANLIGSGAQFSLPLSGALGLDGPYASGDLAVLERSRVDENLQAAEQRFLNASRGIERREWLSGLELPLLALTRRALMADLVVMGDMPPDRDGALKFISTGDAVMKAGRPVLRVPARGMGFEPRTVIIAWKDTRQARRAVADALPFLRRADTVMIYTVPEGGGREAANASMSGLISYLSPHDIKATGVCLPATDTPGADLLQAAGRSGADLIVAGAYGRSRLEEWVFSGVTHTLLKDAQIPILFSH